MACAPYFANVEDLPSPLPTVEQIESSRGEDVFVEAPGRRVVKVGEHFVVKYGEAIDAIEGDNLLFLRQQSIPVPKVYALYEENGKNYIVMEQVPGDSLHNLWPTMDTLQKEQVTEKLRLIWKKIRAIPSPGGYCSVGGLPLEEVIFWTGKDRIPLNGPFNTEEEMNEAILKKYMLDDLSKCKGHKAAYYKRAFPHVLKNHPPVFTHADFQRKNVVIRKTVDGDIVDFEVTIVDWQASGWYPSYWEYSKAIWGCGNWKDDWHMSIGRVMDEYFMEWAWVNMVMIECWS